MWTDEHRERLEELEASISDEVADGVDKMILVEQADADCLIAARTEITRLTAERDKLQAFKDWTHAYLDTHGVPHHPPGTHGAAGCRIGDRMDWLMAEREALQACVRYADKFESDQNDSDWDELKRKAGIS